MNKYLNESELGLWLAKQRKFAIEEQRKAVASKWPDEQQDAYWQGYIDVIETLAEDMEICLDAI